MVEAKMLEAVNNKAQQAQRDIVTTNSLGRFADFKAHNRLAPLHFCYCLEQITTNFLNV
jgi:hypothetical protein